MSILEYYLDKDTAKARAKALGLKVRTTRNCVLDPEAVVDYTGYTSPNGFGGAAAQYWSRLYVIDSL